MKLNQITIPSTDVAKSVLFYQQLGLKLIVDSSPRYVRFLLPEGDSTFSIHQVEEPRQADGIWIYFECENLDEKINQLEVQGIQIDEKPEDKDWLWREARLKDPDGHQLILFWAGENRINPPWRV